MDHTTPGQGLDPQDIRRAFWLVVCIGALAGLAHVSAILWPQSVQQPAQFYRPDPTPYIIETQHTEYNFLSKNCFGSCTGFQP